MRGPVSVSPQCHTAVTHQVLGCVGDGRGGRVSDFDIPDRRMSVNNRDEHLFKKLPLIRDGFGRKHRLPIGEGQIVMQSRYINAAQGPTFYSRS